jgi:peptide deformylase
MKNKKEMFTILEYPNPLLKQKAETIKDLSREVQIATEKMINTLVYGTDNGIGLASTQVGLPYSIILFWTSSDHKASFSDLPTILYNAEIVSESKEIQESTEGCLSLPGLEVTVQRHSSVTVMGKRSLIGRGWEDFIRTFTGESATILQHEIDHLNGITLLDRVSKLKKQMLAKKILKARKRNE